MRARIAVAHKQTCHGKGEQSSRRSFDPVRRSFDPVRPSGSRCDLPRDSALREQPSLLTAAIPCVDRRGPIRCSLGSSTKARTLAQDQFRRSHADLRHGVNSAVRRIDPPHHFSLNSNNDLCKCQSAGSRNRRLRPSNLRRGEALLSCRFNRPGVLPLCHDRLRRFRHRCSPSSSSKTRLQRALICSSSTARSPSAPCSFPRSAAAWRGCTMAAA